MNTNLVSIIKGIIAEQGESILADPARLKPFIKDYAKSVPQDERRAFGRCIEAGFYRLLKAANTTEERRRFKADCARQLQNAAGISAALAAGALDVLEAALPFPPERTQTAYHAKGGTGKIRVLSEKISRKTIIFGAVGGAGAFVGEMVSDKFRTGMHFSDVAGIYVLEIAFWAGILSAGISIALLVAQHLVQHKRFNIKQIVLPTILGIAVGASAGGVAQMVFNVTQNISPFVKTTSNVLCWGLFGTGLGLGVSFFIPNYSRKKAMIAGFFGGTLGGTIYVALLSSDTNTGSIIGVIVLGLTIGLMISVVEEASRIAWLTLIWGPKETATISLGAKPLIFGSTPEADVYVPHKKGDTKPLPVRAVVSLENGQVVYEDKTTDRRDILPNGGEITLDRLRVVVNTK